jgi:hypothetical protein
MNKAKIKIVEFYLKNYAPFYESMGLREFHFDKRDSQYSTTLIIGANGTGKSFLITELSPQTIEHIVGRVANRFMDGVDGEKRIHYVVNDAYEYVCKIIYDKNHKTSCFMKKIDLSTGMEEELNPNGNVTSYQELCEIHLHYNKTYKNIGYITEDVKNVITMSFAERQQMFSTWIPDTSQFLSATKIIHKKINSTKKEIENLMADITKISISAYRENLNNHKLNLGVIENNLLFYRDHISKTNLILNSLNKYERGLLQEHIHLFKDKVKAHNDRLKKNRNVFIEYSAYLCNDGEIKLLTDIGNLREKKIRIENDIDNINNKLSVIQNSIGRIRSTNEQFLVEGNVKQEDVISIDDTINSIRSSLAQLDITFHDALNESPFLAEVVYTTELKDAVKQFITLFLSIFQMSKGIIQSCDGFTLDDIFNDKIDIITNYKDTIKSLNEQNTILQDSLNTLRTHQMEMTRLAIDESFISFIPDGCSEVTCRLVREMKNHLNFDPTSTNIEIDNKQNVIDKNKEELAILNNKLLVINNIIDEVTRINDLMYKENDKVALLPHHIIEKINDTNIDRLINSISFIVFDLQKLDEYISILEKIKSSNESIQNLGNIFKMLKQNDALNEDLAQYLEEEIDLMKQRESLITSLNDTSKELDRLSDLNKSISEITIEKNYLDEDGVALKQEKDRLLCENENLYNKRMLTEALRSFKNKEADLVKNEVLIKTEIEKCTSMIANRKVLEERKEMFEKKLRLYELLYGVWNPRTGYPSMLIKEFLDEVTFITNSSLDNIWGGLIRIVEFRIGENEFRIPVIRGNTVLGDISECSKAEKHTLALAISLAIIQVSTSYNIVRLDEVDDGFDDTRRQTFLDLISQQFLISGCEDSYIITHNQYFENIPCNVILLKGYDLLISDSVLENKNILFKYQSV